MGQGLTKKTSATMTTTITKDSEPTESLTSVSSPLEEYQLQKRRPGCTGMFWRSDPTGETRLASNNDWPRDNAMLRGKVVQAENGEKWLLVSEVKQARSKTWTKAPKGAALPFEYNNHYYLG